MLRKWCLDIYWIILFHLALHRSLKTPLFPCFFLYKSVIRLISPNLSSFSSSFFMSDSPTIQSFWVFSHVPQPAYNAKKMIPHYNNDNAGKTRYRYPFSFIHCAHKPIAFSVQIAFFANNRPLNSSFSRKDAKAQSLVNQTIIQVLVLNSLL